MPLGAALALASALCYGIVDLVGGLLARRADPTSVAFVAQCGALVLTVPIALLGPGSTIAVEDLLWGATSGLGTGVGMVFLFRGLATGAFSVVVPIVAVGGVAIPVAVGVAVLGDRPSGVAWAGMLLALPALWLVLRPTSARVPSPAAWAGAGEAAVASVGIAVQYLALAQADSSAGLWPIAAGRVTAIAAVVPFALRPLGSAEIGRGTALLAALTGAGAAAALFLYLLAANEGILAVTVVLASLYPVVPVVVGIAWFRERLTSRRAAGLLAAGLAMVMLSRG